jgi:hypothetical protein
MDMFQIINKTTNIGFDGQKKEINGFTHKTSIKTIYSKHKYNVRLIHHSEKEWLLKNTKLSNIHYWTGWNRFFLNSLIYLLNKTKWFSKWIYKGTHPLLKKFKNKTSHRLEPAYLIVSINGKRNGKQENKEWQVKAYSDYGATAIMAVEITLLSMEIKQKGVFHPADIISMDQLLPKLVREDIIISKINNDEENKKICC